MGHVPSGPVPQEGPGHEFSGREHRGAGAAAPHLTGRRLARFGEHVAEHFLVRRGGRVVARNLRAGKGEIDLLVRFGPQLVAVEVKARRRGGVDPVEAFTARKAQLVRRSARALSPPAHRVDLVTVTVCDGGVDIRWLPEAG